MSTPLELAQEIVAGGNGQGHSYFDLFRNAKAISSALIEAEKQREPVQVNKQDWDRYGKYPCCGRYGVEEGNPAFCQYCGRPLKWKEKA